MISEETHEMILAMYSTGEYTHQQVAEISGQTYKNVSGIYHNEKESCGLPKPPRKLRNTEKTLLRANLEKAYKEYCAGDTLKIIGERYGNITRERVRQVFSKSGLVSRPSGYFRKYTHCTEGHELDKGEFQKACRICKKLKAEARARGEHFKKVCKHGHEMTKDNIIYFKYKSGNTGRRCKKCHSSAMQMRWIRKQLHDVYI